MSEWQEARYEMAEENISMKLADLPACPVETTLTLISDKWKVLILRDLMPGTKRFGELKKSIGHVTQKVLTAQLRQMEASGLVSRKVYAEVPPRVEYTLTELGYSLKPILDAMWVWGENYKQKLAQPMLLRPHHGMCLAYFKGEGYSDGFSVHMKEVLDNLQNGDGMDVQLHVGTDEICSACPNNQNGQCTDAALVEKYDNAVLEACGLSNGEQISFADFTEKVQENLLANGKRTEICGGCKWNGICESEKSRWES